MTGQRWHEIWMEQCEAAESIRLRYGVGSGLRLLGRREASEPCGSGDGTPGVRTGAAALRFQRERDVHAGGN